MSGNELLSREDILKEEFNSQSIETTEFIKFFTSILQLAYDFNLIDIEQRNLIARNIIIAIEESIILSREFDDKSNATENYMYVISSYLQSKSNWEAWCELRKINSVISAKEFLARAKSWLKFRLKSATLNLAKIKQTVLVLNLQNITSCFQNLVNIIKQFEGFDYANVGINLKLSHGDVSMVSIGNYEFVRNDFSSSPNFLERLCECVYEFCMEVGILNTINAKNIIENKQIEAMEDHSRAFEKIEKINRFYKKKLSDLRKEKADNLDYYFDSLHKPGRKRKGCSDEVEIEQEYARKKRALEKEYKQKMALAKKKNEEATYNKMELLKDEYSLVDIIKEYAIFSLAQSGKRLYPESLEERAILLNTIDISFAIEEFVNGIHNLTNEQRKYLLENR